MMMGNSSSTNHPYERVNQQESGIELIRTPGSKFNEPARNAVWSFMVG